MSPLDSWLAAHDLAPLAKHMNGQHDQAKHGRRSGGQGLARRTSGKTERAQRREGIARAKEKADAARASVEARAGQPGGKSLSVGPKDDPAPAAAAAPPPQRSEGRRGTTSRATQAPKAEKAEAPKAPAPSESTSSKSSPLTHDENGGLRLHPSLVGKREGLPNWALTTAEPVKGVETVLRSGLDQGMTREQWVDRAHQEFENRRKIVAGEDPGRGDDPALALKRDPSLKGHEFTREHAEALVDHAIERGQQEGWLTSSGALDDPKFGRRNRDQFGNWERGATGKGTTDGWAHKDRVRHGRVMDALKTSDAGKALRGIGDLLGYQGDNHHDPYAPGSLPAMVTEQARAVNSFKPKATASDRARGAWAQVVDRSVTHLASGWGMGDSQRDKLNPNARAVTVRQQLQAMADDPAELSRFLGNAHKLSAKATRELQARISTQLLPAMSGEKVSKLAATAGRRR